MMEDLLMSKLTPTNEKQHTIPMNIQSYIFSPIFIEQYSSGQVTTNFSSFSKQKKFTKLLSSIIYRIISENLFVDYNSFFTTQPNCFTGKKKKRKNFYSIFEMKR